jgi:hypothetical protein
MLMGDQQRATPAILVPVAVVPSSIKFVTPRRVTRLTRITGITGIAAISQDGVRMQGHRGLNATIKLSNVLDAE